MPKKQSKKHHYLPRKYLKGFTDKNNGFWVYDKKEKKIFKSSPDSTFFENNLNTINFSNQESSDFLEDLYTNLENQSWKSFDRIISSNKNNPIQDLDKMNLLFFLLCLHQRLPANKNYIQKISNKLNFGDIGPFSIKMKNDKDIPVKIRT